MTNEEAIDEIMDHFDFHKVHRVMTHLDWKWTDSNGVSEIPHIYDLRKTARRLMRYAMKQREGYEIATGGFHVTYYRPGSLSLKFIVEQEDTCG